MDDISQRTVVNTSASLHEPTLKPKACKRASALPTQRRTSNFFPTLKKIKHPTHSPTMTLKLNNENDLQCRPTEHQQPTSIWRNGG